MSFVVNEASYHSGILRINPALIDSIVKRVKESGCDTIIGTGISGVAPLMMVSYFSDVPYAVARKEGDTRHCSHSVVGPVGEKVLIIDDFVSSGRTIRRIMEAIEKEIDRKLSWTGGTAGTVTIVGVLTYTDDTVHIADRESLRQRQWLEDIELTHVKL
jgi:hypothetical protein